MVCATQDLTLIDIFTDKKLVQAHLFNMANQSAPLQEPESKHTASIVQFKRGAVTNVHGRQVKSNHKSMGPERLY